MKMVSLALVCFSILSSSCRATGSSGKSEGMNIDAESEIFGNWRSHGVLKSDKGYYRVFFQITPKEFTVTAECSKKGLKVYASASSPILIADEHIELLEARYSEEIVKGFVCKVGVPKTKLKVSVKGDVLTLSHRGNFETASRVLN